MDDINLDEINREKHNLVKQFIVDRIKDRNLNFEDLLKFFTECLKKKDHEEAIMWIYYINNIVKKRPDMDDAYRNELIVSMLDDLKTAASDASCR